MCQSELSGGKKKIRKKPVSAAARVWTNVIIYCSLFDAERVSAAAGKMYEGQESSAAECKMHRGDHSLDFPLETK